MNEEQGDWRLNPVTERELAQDRRQERKRRRNLWALVLASIGLCPFACFGTCMSLGAGSDAWGFVLASALSIGAFVAIVMRYTHLAALGRARRLALRQEFGGVAGWLVELTVHQGEAVSGRDVGIAWFEGDRMYFTGSRTSFGLGPADVRGGALDASSTIEIGPHLMLPLRKETIVGPLSLGFRFMPSEPENAGLTSNETGFREALRGWSTAGGNTQGQLPPLAPGPDLASVWALQARAVLASATVPGALVLLTLFGFSSGSFVAVLFGLGLVLALWTPARSPRRCWRAIHDRLRLEAYNKEQ